MAGSGKFLYCLWGAGLLIQGWGFCAGLAAHGGLCCVGQTMPTCRWPPCGRDSGQRI